MIGYSEKLRFCNHILLVLLPVMLLPAIHLEITGSESVSLVWCHIVFGCLLLFGILWHLYLNFGCNSWIYMFGKHKKTPVTKWLAIIWLLTFITSIMTVSHWIGSYGHTSIGAVHGKFGFVALSITVWHALKHIAYFKPRKLN